ncbi:Six-bladed beta-propeller, TolB-like protein [Purpureocillium lavendulum]|uniref:Six-bladed beta-propeller, TolB-like protein n=1 Tax=Purpureocillium lavendulum TaxID=1247861 RepID=A0AB34FTI2_9HYPO|nr:Six-bladed beta-propeller, TolB-like protein [Purpureocillium lavendulum]
MPRTIAALALSLLAGPAGALADVSVRMQQLYQFPNATQFVENIAIRPNGNLLLNTFDDGRMYTLDPRWRSGGGDAARLVVKVPGIDGLTGIAEIAPDVFAVSGGVNNLSDYSFVLGTARIVTVDFNRRHSGGSTGGGGTGNTPTVRTVARVPDTRMLNGLVALPRHPHVVLSADSKGGRVLRTDTRTGRVDVAFADSRLAPGTGPPPELVPLGINGVRIAAAEGGWFLYLTSSARRTFMRVRIDEWGNRRGELETLAQLPGSPIEDAKVPDDFALARDGSAYVATHLSTLVKVAPDGRWTSVVGAEGDAKLDSPTSAVLTRDEKTLYVVTAGGIDGKGGQVVAVHL